jgi:hypothetical protein
MIFNLFARNKTNVLHRSVEPAALCGLRHLELIFRKVDIRKYNHRDALDNAYAGL